MRLAEASKAYRASLKYKSLNLESEEAKTAYWKMIDRRRVGWWGVIAKKIEPLYEKEANEIAKAIKGKETVEEIEAEVARAIKELQPEWEKVMTAILMTIISDFGEKTMRELGV